MQEANVCFDDVDGSGGLCKIQLNTTDLASADALVIRSHAAVIS